jgi:riboflavin kinase/FMN adenylyltransferase
MKITYGMEAASFNPSTVATLGSYDGLHLGHRDILNALLRKKKDEGFDRSLVLTFDPHPQEVLKKNNTSIQLLTTIEERLALIESMGIDETIVIPFSFEFSQTPYTEFFEKSLVGKLGVKAMVVGINHAFGKNREGDIDHLEALAETLSVEIVEVPPHFIDGVHISSTKIRHALLDGNLSIVRSYLGRDYELSGTVVGGDKLGRELGFPTANIQAAPNKLIPKDGVYSGLAMIDKKQYKAAISIGTRPTVTDKADRVIEALLLDFSENIYGRQLTITLSTYLREQIAFSSLEALKKQMKLDVDQVKGL